MFLRIGILSFAFVAWCFVGANESNAQVGPVIYSPGFNVGVANVRPRNLGQPYRNGQIVRYGTRNAGVRISVQNGVRIGTRRWGVQFGTGNGIQTGRLYRRW